MSAVKKTSLGRKDLVVGLGVTGLSAARYLKRANIDAAFFDSHNEAVGIEALSGIWPNAEVMTGDSDLPGDVDRLIVSPGVPDGHPLLQAAMAAKLEIVSDIELFARDARAPFVAVTGSNGKSTVTTLLYHMCHASGRNTLAGANLGRPALDLLNEETPDLYVL